MKKANAYNCIDTPRFKFLDISHFLAPGCSYSEFLKAYGAQQMKGCFPYEFMDGVDKLLYPRLPDFFQN